jgi:hypothetical protein
MCKALLIALVLLAACARAGPNGFAANTGRILPASSDAACSAGDSTADARWTPRAEEIRLLDPVLLKLIEYRLAEDNLTYRDTVSLEPARYYRDYSGITRARQNYILICGQYASTPRYIHDGGPSRFIALFDVTRHTFISFEFGYRA